VQRRRGTEEKKRKWHLIIRQQKRIEEQSRVDKSIYTPDKGRADKQKEEKQSKEKRKEEKNIEEKLQRKEEET